MHYDFITPYFLLLVLVLMPALGIVSYYRLKSGKPLSPKPKRFATIIAFQIVLLVLSFQAAALNEISLFPSISPNPTELLFGALMLGITLSGFVRGWRRANEERRRRFKLLLPENGRELVWWLPISLLAGIGEEIAYRGVLFSFALGWTGSLGLTLLICVATFAIAHMTQGPKAVLGVALLALMFHGLVFLTGALYLAIGIHVIYDLTVGIIAVRLTKSEAQAARAAAASSI